MCLFQCKMWKSNVENISYPLFADADTEIYPHAALRYHVRPKAKRGIAVLSVYKFPYPRKQTWGNEFIPCSNVWNLFKVLKSCFEVKPISIAQRNIYEERPATDWYCDITRWHTAIVTSDIMSCTSTWHDDAFTRFAPGVETHRRQSQLENPTATSSKCYTYSDMVRQHKFIIQSTALLAPKLYRPKNRQIIAILTNATRHQRKYIKYNRLQNYNRQKLRSLVRVIFIS